MLFHGKCCGHKVLWDGIFSFPFVKEGPVFPKLKEVIKEVSKLLSYHLENSNSSYHGYDLDTHRSFHFVTNLS